MPNLLRLPLFALLALILALPATPQSLIEQVPASSALYVGWRGTSDMGPAYEGSNLQGMLKEVGLLEAVPELLELIQTLGEEGQIEEDEAQMIAMVATLLTSMWTDGGAIYMLPPDPQGPPIPKLCVMWSKADNQDQLKNALNTVVAILEEQLPTFTGELEDALFLSIGFNPADAKVASLSTSGRFKTATKHVQDDAALVVYADAKEWIKQIDGFAKMMRDQAEAQDVPAEHFAEMWPTVSQAMGLSGLDSFAFSAGLKDKNWHSQLFIGAPTPRRGVLSLLDNEPLAASSLLHIPKTATYAQVFSMQPSRVLDVTMDVARAVDPEIVASITEGLKEISEEVGFDIEMKLIRGMGPAWSVYIDPMIAGNGFASVVFINDLQNADSVKQAMAQLSTKANVFFEEEEDEVKIRFFTKEVGGVAVTHLGIPFVAPAWAVHNGKLYVSLYPQGIEMAIAQSGKREDSILANESFQTAMSRFSIRPANANAFENLGPITGFSFADLPKTAPEGYGMNMMIMQIATGMSEMFTGEPSNIRMPPIGKIMPFIEVSGGITRVDDDGLHIHLVEPFPGATLLSASKGLTSGAGLTAPMAVAILLPALGSARDAARDVQTTAQARQIGIANIAYAVDNKDVYADDIAQLEEYLGDAELLISPQSLRADDIPANFADLPEAQRKAFLRKNSSFVLVPLGKMDLVRKPGETVMLFERPDDTEDFELVVTMADGSTQKMPQNQLTDLLGRQNGQAINQLIERQENLGG